MTVSPFTVLDAGAATRVTAATVGDRVRLSPRDVRTALGWEVTPEGLCRDGLCVPVPPGSVSVSGDGVDLAELAAALGRPIALDVAEAAAYLGVSAGHRGAALASLQAPDFALPDLDGRVHRLSEHLGKKVLLVAYASW